MQIRHSENTKSNLANSMITSNKYLEASRRSPVQEEEGRKSFSANLARYGSTVLVFLMVGTGGALTPENLNAAMRENKGFRVNELKQQEVFQPEIAPQVATAAEELAFVKETLKPSVTELAQFFGVSRQAIYNWQAGERLADQNQLLLTELANAAQLLKQYGITGSYTVKRKLPGGKTMLELLKSGKEGKLAAEELISLLRREAEERQQLSERLKGRDISVSLDAIGMHAESKSV